MSKHKILVILLVASTTLSFIACNKEKKDTVKEDAKEVMETITNEDEEAGNVEEYSKETEDKKEENNEVATTNNSSANNKEESKTIASNTNSNSTSNNIQQPNNNNNNNNNEKQEIPTQQPTPTPQPTPSTPTKTYKVRGDLVNTVFSVVNNYTSTNLNKKLTLSGNYNFIGEQYIAYRIGQGDNPTAVNVKYTYAETDNINMVKEIPAVIGDRYSGGNECSVVVIENSGMYSIVFVSKY
ncbi:hypothetical protein [Clostridium sp. UBA1652]|uniref:hypothetical protein n=1 Tax=Clostridium sp. UBA1652 TaxID=1946348 RepID=UPI00257ADD0A|nr:hypothetical protein [Clostridium sp. UBA1652]